MSALSFRENLLQPFVEAGDCVFAVDMDQRVVFWNKTAERVTGYGAQEMRGRPCYLSVHAVGKDRAASCKKDCLAILRARSRCSPSAVDLHLATGREGLLWLSCSYALVPEPDGGGLLLHICHDVSSQVEAVQAVSEFVQHFTGVEADSTKAAGNHADAAIACDPALTSRELQILQLLGEGQGTKDIAAQLVLEQGTVRNHVKHLLAKLSVHSRMQAAALARKGFPF